MNAREFCRELETNGFVLKRHSKHLIYSDGNFRIVVPRPHGEIDRRLLKQLKIDLRKAIEWRNTSV